MSDETFELIIHHDVQNNLQCNHYNEFTHHYALIGQKHAHQYIVLWAFPLETISNIVKYETMQSTSEYISMLLCALATCLPGGFSILGVAFIPPQHESASKHAQERMDEIMYSRFWSLFRRLNRASLMTQISNTEQFRYSVISLLCRGHEITSTLHCQTFIPENGFSGNKISSNTYTENAAHINHMNLRSVSFSMRQWIQTETLQMNFPSTLQTYPIAMVENKNETDMLTDFIQFVDASVTIVDKSLDNSGLSNEQTSSVLSLHEPRNETMNGTNHSTVLVQGSSLYHQLSTVHKQKSKPAKKSKKKGSGTHVASIQKTKLTWPDGTELCSPVEAQLYKANTTMCATYPYTKNIMVSPLRMHAPVTCAICSSSEIIFEYLGDAISRLLLQLLMMKHPQSIPWISTITAMARCILCNDCVPSNGVQLMCIPNILNSPSSTSGIEVNETVPNASVSQYDASDTHKIHVKVVECVASNNLGQKIAELQRDILAMRDLNENFTVNNVGSSFARLSESDVSYKSNDTGNSREWQGQIKVLQEGMMNTNPSDIKTSNQLPHKSFYWVAAIVCALITFIIGIVMEA